MRPSRSPAPISRWTAAGRRNKARRAMILVIDNYDSFTYNLVHYLNELGAETHVVRNDAIGVREALGMKPQGVLLSPGPKTPNEPGICLSLVPEAPADLPIFGVCLG